MRLRLFLFLLGCLPLLAHGAEPAHSAAFLDFQPTGIALELRLPLREFERAFGQSLGAKPAEMVPQHRDALETYLLRYLTPNTPDNRRWTKRIRALAVHPPQQPAELVAQLWLEPPADASARSLVFNSELILHAVPGHTMQVQLRNDWNEPSVRAEPELIGVLRAGEASLAIERPPLTAWNVWRARLDPRAVAIVVVLILVSAVLAVRYRPGRPIPARSPSGPA